MRLGVLDVGSNTVHLQIVDTAPGARPNPTANFKEDRWKGVAKCLPRV